jgi:hypothetical protein
MPVLYGTSAMGTRLCFYTKPRGEAILPQQIPAETGMMTDTAPPERWNCDVLEREGEKHVRCRGTGMSLRTTMCRGC